MIGSEVVTYFDAKHWQIGGVDKNMRRSFFGEQGDTRWNHSDGWADRRDAKELAGANEEEVEAGIIDLLSARPAVLVHRAKK